MHRAKKEGFGFSNERINRMSYYIIKDGEGRGWWKPKGLGFTTERSEAGEFSGEDLAIYNLDGCTLERVRQD